MKLVEVATAAMTVDSKFHLELHLGSRDRLPAHLAWRIDARTSPYTVGRSGRKLSGLDSVSGFFAKSIFIRHLVNTPTARCGGGARYHGARRRPRQPGTPGGRRVHCITPGTALPARSGTGLGTSVGCISSTCGKPTAACAALHQKIAKWLSSGLAEVDLVAEAAHAEAAAAPEPDDAMSDEPVVALPDLDEILDAADDVRAPRGR